MFDCKIISVNPYLDSFKSTQNFGEQTDNSGVKTRYVKRREKIMDFFNRNQFKNIKVSLFDAITPNDFKIEGDNVIYKDKTFYCIEPENCRLFHMANLLSHYKIWEIDEDTLIFEDDLILTPELIESTINLVHEYNTVKRNNTILYLQRSVPWLKNCDKQLIFDELISHNLGISSKTDFSGTAAYYITKETKKHILK